MNGAYKRLCSYGSSALFLVRYRSLALRACNPAPAVARALIREIYALCIVIMSHHEISKHEYNYTGAVYFHNTIDFLARRRSDRSKIRAHHSKRATEGAKRSNTETHSESCRRSTGPEKSETLWLDSEVDRSRFCRTLGNAGRMPLPAIGRIREPLIQFQLAPSFVSKSSHLRTYSSTIQFV